jgi:DNA-binding MarR family transcriptional regulator
MEARFEAFTVLIAKASRLIYKIKAEEMAEYNLKGSHVSCLYYIYKEKSLTARQLCDLCGEDKANISRTIKYLENGEYIFCQSRTQKRYQSALLLTEKGKRVGKELVEKIDRVLFNSSNGLTEEQLRIFYQSLSVICENLEKICEQTKRSKK